MKVRKHIQVSMVKNSSCGSLYVWSYTPWKIGFVASPETSQNQVFRVKKSQLLHNRSKFSETNCVGYIIFCSILCNIFISIQQIFHAGHTLQGRSLE
jgi:hypothetical protein